jgi:hypothetical protein
MSIGNLNAAGLRQLISLVEKRDALAAELEKVERALSSALAGGAVPKLSALTKKAGKTSTTGKKGRRGALKEAILNALKEAGAAGLGAKDLSTKLGVKNQNIHVWFSTTGKTVKGLKKTKTGTWSYTP